MLQNVGSPGMMNPAMMSGFMAGLQAAENGGIQGGQSGGGLGGACGMDPRMAGMMRQSQQMQMMEQMMMMLMMMMSGQMGGNNMGNMMGQGQCGGPQGIGQMGGGPGASYGGPGGSYGGPGGSYGGPSGNYGGPGGNFNGNYGNAGNVGGAVPMGSAGQGDAAAVNLGRQYLGQNSSSIRGQLPHFTAAGGQTNNCADFVSSLLESTGGLQGHHVGVSDLESALKKQGYHQVSQAQAKPGDVWMASDRSHTELVTAQGGTRAIGSNNDRPGHQVISEKGLRGGGVFYTKG